jgi:CDP-paratose 2-epimerase
MREGNESQEIALTGSGLIGSEVGEHFAGLGWEIYGVSNNQRAAFFEPQGDNRRIQVIMTLSPAMN